MLYLCRIVIGAAIILGIPSSSLASSLFINTQTGLSFNSVSANLGVEAGIRKPSYGLFFKADWNPWFSPQAVQDALKPGIMNLGIGVEHLYFNDRCRFTASVGSSTLLFDTALDEAWTTGFFIEVSPVSLRWPLTEELTLQVEPTSISLAMPVLSGIPLISFQYRHGISLEWKPQ